MSTVWDEFSKLNTWSVHCNILTFCCYLTSWIMFTVFPNLGLPWHHIIVEWHAFFQRKLAICGQPVVVCCDPTVTSLSTNHSVCETKFKLRGCLRLPASDIFGPFFKLSCRLQKSSETTHKHTIMLNKCEYCNTKLPKNQNRAFFGPILTILGK
jgi:hypothetical protein